MVHYSWLMMRAMSFGKLSKNNCGDDAIEVNLYYKNPPIMATKSYIPKGLSALTPMLALRNCDKAIEWYKKVFKATELNRITDGGKVAHADLQIADCILMVAEEHPDYNRSPDQLNGTSIILNLYVPDVDETVNLALARRSNINFPSQGPILWRSRRKNSRPFWSYVDSFKTYPRCYSGRNAKANGRRSRKITFP